MNTIKKQWFSIAIIICIILAYYYSNAGLTLSAAVAVFLKNCFIFSIFLLSGLTIKTLNLLESIKKWQSHLFIQSVSFILFPLIVVSSAFFLNLNNSINPIYIGFVVLACIPTTISSCVVFTHNANGNRECALFNATIGNMLGIFLTPILIFLIVNENIELNVVQAIKKLLLLVLLPFFIGQIINNNFTVKFSSVFSKLAGNWLMLGIMLIAFINAFNNGFDLGLREVLIIISLCLVLHVFILSAVWYSSARLDFIFDLADRKCITITASQKTVALGLPITAILFANDPNLALITLPVIAYHTIQLFVDGIIVDVMADMK